MNLEILMSTMNKINIENLKLEEKNIPPEIKVLIINQTDNNQRYEKENLRMYNYSEKGLSKSRNRALENAKGDICLIADDDVKYKENTFKIIKKIFKNNPKADIITFQIETPDDGLFKNYPKKEYWHNKRSILKVSSIEIAFKRKKIISNEINYDEKFGLGANYNSGEENIFLMDSLKKGLKIKYIPIPIVIHPYESSGKQLNIKKNIFSKGALFTRLFGWKFSFINLIFALKKHNKYSNKFNMFEALKFLYKGSFNYLREEFKNG